MAPGSDPGAGQLGGLVLAPAVYTAAGGTFGITTGDLIILLQINEIKPANGNYQAIAAWAFKDSLRRRNYTIIPNADGTFKVEPGAVIEEK